ncbi:hypothetical protein MLAC_37690 [Mycobacterium lacus]|uniref:Uncharacterized protein n=1 Tax=Mycobacterium lacus TaxID=169765 RepID=A0A7I7NP76_9MYCO|nr:hypothetical protein MLAC_37690 [Mycobacterium lacus]
MVADGGAVHAVSLGGNGQFDELARGELFGGRLVSEFQFNHQFFLLLHSLLVDSRSRPASPGSALDIRLPGKDGSVKVHINPDGAGVPDIPPLSRLALPEATLPRPDGRAPTRCAATSRASARPRRAQDTYGQRGHRPQCRRRRPLIGGGHATSWRPKAPQECGER